MQNKDFPLQFCNSFATYGSFLVQIDVFLLDFFFVQFAQFLGSWNRTGRGCRGELVLNGSRACIIRTRWLDWLQLCWVPSQAAAEGKAHASSPQTLRTDGGKTGRGKKQKKYKKKWISRPTPWQQYALKSIHENMPTELLYVSEKLRKTEPRM